MIGAVLTSRPVILTLCSLALAGCGGSGSTQADTETAGETQDPRAGYFHASESTTMNPPLKQYDTAWKTYQQGNDACNKEASRLYAAGATPRKAVQCHLRRNKALIVANANLRGAVSELNGDYRTACDAQIKRFSAAVGKVDKALQQIRKDWNAYAKSGTAPARLTRDFRAADLRYQGVLSQGVAKLSAACYTEADRTE